MEKLYNSTYLILEQYNGNNEIPYRIFNTITTDNKMDSYSRQFCALNDYAYFITENLNNRIKQIDERMNEILGWLQSPETDTEIDTEIDDCTDPYDFIDLYFSEEEDKNLWMFLIEPININIIIMALLSFCEGVLKEITTNFIKKTTINIIRKRPKSIANCLKILSFYDKDKIMKKICKDILIIKKAKKVRNTFVHEQWITINNNKWNFKTTKKLNEISIVDLINAITNLLEVVEEIGIKSGIYQVKL